MTAVWRPGAQHKVVDCVSRHPVEDSDSDDDGADVDACLMTRWLQSTRTMIQVRQLWKMLSLSKSEMLVRRMTLKESWRSAFLLDFQRAAKTCHWPFALIGRSKMIWQLSMTLFCLASEWLFHLRCESRWCKHCMFITRDRFAHFDEHARPYTGQTSYRTFVQWWSSASIAQNARPPSLSNRLLWKAIHLVLLKVLQPIFSAWMKKIFGYRGEILGMASHHTISTARCYLSSCHSGSERHDDGERYSRQVPLWWRSSVCLQRFSQFCEDGGITYVRSSPHAPPSGEWRSRSCCQGHEAFNSEVNLSRKFGHWWISQGNDRVSEHPQS